MLLSSVESWYTFYYYGAIKKYSTPEKPTTKLEITEAHNDRLCKTTSASLSEIFTSTESNIV